MTKLLLNAGSTPLYNAAGAPIAPGDVVLDDEMAPEHEALYDDGTLVYVRPGDVPEDAANISQGARAHLDEWRAERDASKPARRRGNAEAATSDDAGVTDSTEKGGQS